MRDLVRMLFSIVNIDRFVSSRLLISNLARKVRADRLTYLSHKKIYRLETALHDLNRDRVPGGFVEFGVALGGSGILIAKSATDAGRPFHGFDVFGMIPPPTSQKDDAKSKERYKIISQGQSKGIGGDSYYGYVEDLYGQVCKTFERYGVGCSPERVMLHKGLFEETWPHVTTGPIAFAHIDCDWYDPVKYCLEALDPLLSPQGQILLDDYNDYGGCRAATDEFVAARPNYRFEDGVNPLLIKLS